MSTITNFSSTLLFASVTDCLNGDNKSKEEEEKER